MNIIKNLIPNININLEAESRAELVTHFILSRFFIKFFSGSSPELNRVRPSFED